MRSSQKNFSQSFFLYTISLGLLEVSKSLQKGLKYRTFYLKVIHIRLPRHSIDGINSRLVLESRQRSLRRGFLSSSLHYAHENYCFSFFIFCIMFIYMLCVFVFFFSFFVLFFLVYCEF